ncbi:MAG: hypothetical protein S0880_02105 [Actinomycetota bacterium]|nr:hypothetical protein [Actinomycetota bacterium]
MKVATVGSWTVGLGRVATGVGFLAAADRAAKRWVGDSSPTSVYLVRAVAARDLAIGAGLVWALARRRDPLSWLAASVVSDLGDSIGSVVLPPEHRRISVVAAGGFGALGAATAAAVARSRA